MRTDDYGKEIMRQVSRRRRGGRLFILGLATGVGLCLGLGPPLPMVSPQYYPTATTDDGGWSSVSLPRRWQAALHGVQSWPGLLPLVKANVPESRIVALNGLLNKAVCSHYPPQLRCPFG